MKWITREKARVDRIACPWLIARFIDRTPPFHVPGAELGHHGDRCSFDAFLDRYGLDDPALRALALVVRGADTEARALAPEAPGLYALASGFRALARDDHENMRLQFPAYDALYAYCRARLHGRSEEHTSE